MTSSAENPLISVIIPTYNRAAFIKDAIESVLNQTYRNYEIIVVDDGSIDNTKQIISSIAGPIRYIYKSNSGPSPSRNRGIRESRGEYIAFLDSDDLWDSNKLEEQLKVIMGDSRVGVVFSDVRYIDEKGVIVCDSIANGRQVVTDNFIKDILDINFPFPSSSAVMVAKKAISEVGLFDETLRLSEDLDLWVRIALRFKVGYLKEPVVSVRRHQNSLVHQSNTAKIMVRSVETLDRYRDQIKKTIQEYDVFTAKFFEWAATAELFSGQRFKAFGLFWQAKQRDLRNIKRYKDLLRCFLPMWYLKNRYQAALKASQEKQAC